MNKKIEFVEIESIRCADPLYQQEILENQHIFYSNGSQEISQNSEFCRF
ncbi:MAG: hypothetical protein OXE55_05495 [Flavobacteriaceae bacterium]|nr:hypothetical protein [Flavobacteriaceae bacterium]